MEESADGRIGRVVRDHGKDPERLTAFYCELFGWSTGDSGDPSYRLLDTGAGEGAIGGGIGPANDESGTGGTTVYMKVDDLQGYLDKAEKLGEATVVPPMDLPGEFGRFAMFADPEGHVVGCGREAR
jgi:uncharacterized protein